MNIGCAMLIISLAFCATNAQSLMVGTKMEARTVLL